MAAEPTTLAERRGRNGSLAAAAMRFDDVEGDRSEWRRQLKRHERWQEQAWAMYYEVPEFGFVVDFSAELLARGRLYVGVRPEPNAGLVPIDDEDSGVEKSLANWAVDKLLELQSPVGGQAQLIRQAEANTRVAGEWYLLHYTGTNEALHGWHIRSSEDITVEADVIKSTGLGRFAVDEVSRVWSPDPKAFEKAHSGTRRVLAQCETVLLIDRQFRASLRSRLFSGLLLLSNGFRSGMVPEAAETAGDGEAALDPVIANMMMTLSTAIQDEGSASAVVPNTLWGNLEDVKDGARLLSLGQQIDPALMELRTSCIKRIAQGLEYPAEIVEGMADVNHFTAWAVGEQAVQMAEPKAAFLADAFTTVFLRPELEAEGFPADVLELVEVAFDLSPLQKRPNADEDIRYAYEHGEASGRGLRRVLQIPESDAPDDTDVERYLLLNKGTVGPNLMTELLRRNIAEDLAPVSESTGGPSAPGGNAPPGEPPMNPPPIPAAANTAPPAHNRLSAIDISLTERLFAASLAAFRAALDGAGLKAKRNVSAMHRAAVKNVKPAQVVATLGPTLMAAAGLDDDKLLAGALIALRVDFDRWVAAAQADALDAAIAMAGADPDESRVEEFVAAQAQDREDAWEWFEGAATALLVERMANGQGLADWEVRDLVRRSLARAGGADELAPFEPGQVPADGYGTGLATGPLILGALAGFGIGVTSWEWNHGEPAHPFPEHVELHHDRAPTEDGFGDQPGSHQGCFPAGVEVSGPVATGATLRHYEGVLVDLGFASGKFLTATPNHPILTRHGWVAAGLLNEGDEIIRCEGADRVAALVPYDRQVVAPIEDVVASFWEASSVSTRTVPVAAEDFDGDGVGSEVCVVWTDGALRRRDDSALGQPTSELAFVWRDEQPALLARDRSSAQRLVGVGASALGGVSRSNDGGSALRRASGSDNQRGVAETSSGDTSGAETTVDGLSRASIGLSEVDGGLAGLIPSDEFIDRDIDSVPRALDATALEFAVKRRLADAGSRLDGFGGITPSIEADCFVVVDAASTQFNAASFERGVQVADLDVRGVDDGFDVGAFDVQTDRLVEISRRQFSGHVYNLQTVAGWYIAGGVIVHNCTCWIEPIFSGGDEQ